MVCKTVLLLSRRVALSGIFKKTISSLLIPYKLFKDWSIKYTHIYNETCSQWPYFNSLGLLIVSTVSELVVSKAELLLMSRELRAPLKNKCIWHHTPNRWGTIKQQQQSVPGNEHVNNQDRRSQDLKWSSKNLQRQQWDGYDDHCKISFLIPKWVGA